MIKVCLPSDETQSADHRSASSITLSRHTTHSLTPPPPHSLRSLNLAPHQQLWSVKKNEEAAAKKKPKMSAAQLRVQKGESARGGPPPIHLDSRRPILQDVTLYRTLIFLGLGYKLRCIC